MTITRSAFLAPFKDRVFGWYHTTLIHLGETRIEPDTRGKGTVQEGPIIYWVSSPLAGLDVLNELPPSHDTARHGTSFGSIWSVKIHIYIYKIMQKNIYSNSI